MVHHLTGDYLDPDLASADAQDCQLVLAMAICHWCLQSCCQVFFLHLELTHDDFCDIETKAAQRGERVSDTVRMQELTSC